MYTNKNLNDLIPNKISYIILGILVFGFIAYGAIFTYRKKINENNEKKVIEVQEIDDEKDTLKDDEMFLDSDNDGAYDWVENLWPELDPHNPDSDGDGVLDGKYIQQKRLIREKERRGAEGIESTLSESEKLGRSVYTALLAIQQSGAEMDDVTRDQMANNVVDYVSELSLGSKLYLRDDLIKVPDTKENSLAYMDTMKAFFKKYPINTSEITLILQATKEPKRFAIDIEKAAIKYNSYIQELSIMKVPALIAGRHTELLNAAGQLEGALKNLTLENYDEIVALSSMVQMEKTLGSIIDANSHIEKYFEIISQKGAFDN